MADLLQLAERCEKASANEQGDALREAYGAVFGFLPRDMALKDMPEGALKRQARFTGLMNTEAFLDAAMMLVPEGFAYSVGNINPETCRCNAYVVPPTFDIGANIRTGATPALALCAAALRARTQGANHNG